MSVLATISELDHSDRLEELRDQVLAAAKAADVAPIEETLKWGQPAFVPPKREGTTLRLGAREDHVALFVHCQTDLVSRWRTLFPHAFQYEDNRAVRIPATGDYDADAFHHLATMALTYHREKRAAVQT